MVTRLSGFMAETLPSRAANTRYLLLNLTVILSLIAYMSTRAGRVWRGFIRVKRIKRAAASYSLAMPKITARKLHVNYCILLV